MHSIARLVLHPFITNIQVRLFLFGTRNICTWDSRAPSSSIFHVPFFSSIRQFFSIHTLTGDVCSIYCQTICECRLVPSKPHCEYLSCSGGNLFWRKWGCFYNFSHGSPRLICVGFLGQDGTRWSASPSSSRLQWHGRLPYEREYYQSCWSITW